MVAQNRRRSRDSKWFIGSLGGKGNVEFEWRGCYEPDPSLDSARAAKSASTIRKGTAELISGISCCDAFSCRGRFRAEEHLPNLLSDIKDLVTSQSQADPRFRTLRLYTRISAEEVRRQLLATGGYTDEQLPTARTIRSKLNDLGFHPTKVLKCQPQKRSSRPTPSSTG